MATDYAIRTIDRIRDRAVAMQDLANWLDNTTATTPNTESNNEFLDLLVPYMSDRYVHTVYLTVNKYDYDTNESLIDEEATQANIRRFTRACRGIVTKEYDGDTLVYVKEFPTFTLKGKVDRKTVCKPVKVEKEWHEPYTSQGYWSEKVVEWDCE